MRKLITFSLLCAVLMGVSAHAQTQKMTASKNDTVNYLNAGGKVISVTSKYGKLEGVVFDKQKGIPIRDVTISVLSDKWILNHNKYSKPIKSTIVNDKGQWNIDSLRESKYCLRIVAKDTLFEEIYYTGITIRRGLILPLNIQLNTKREYPVIIDNAPMINNNETATIRRWTKDEINKLPGH